MKIWSSVLLPLLLVTPARAEEVAQQSRPLLTLEPDSGQRLRAAEMPEGTLAGDAWLVFVDELPFRGRLALRAHDDATGESPAPHAPALLRMPRWRWWHHVTWGAGGSGSPVRVSFVEDGDATPDDSPLVAGLVRSARFAVWGLSPGEHVLVATLEWPAGQPLEGLRVSSEPVVLVVRDGSEDEQLARVRRDEAAERALGTGDYAAFEKIMLEELARRPSVGRWKQLAEASVGKAPLATTAAYFGEAVMALQAEIARSCGAAPPARDCGELEALQASLSSFGRLRPFLESVPDLRFLVLKRHGTRRYAVVGHGLDLRFDAVDDRLLERVHRATQPTSTTMSR